MVSEEKVRRRFRPCGVAIVALVPWLLLLAGPLSAQLSRDDAKCRSRIGKGVRRLTDAIVKGSLGCHRDLVRCGVQPGAAYADADPYAHRDTGAAIGNADTDRDELAYANCYALADAHADQYGDLDSDAHVDAIAHADPDRDADGNRNTDTD